MRYVSRRGFLARAGAVAALGLSLPGAAAGRSASGYTWDSVPIGGGGFVTAVIASRSEPGVVYARTDVGGAYRWSPDGQRWHALLDWVGEDQTGFLGIDALAIDPDDAASIWLLAGIAYLNGGRTAILRSRDHGKTFDIVDVGKQFKTHGNGFGRQNGERLAVEPGSKGQRLVLGSRRDGLFASKDGGRTWERSAQLGVTTTPNDVGLNIVLFDPAGASDGRLRLFVGVSRHTGVGPNLYRSDDGGAHFAAVAGTPAGLMPQRAVLDGAGHLVVTWADGAGPHPDSAGREPVGRGQVTRLHIASGVWTDITPRGWTRPFAGVDVAPGDPQRLVVSTINTFLPQGDGRKGDRIFLSNDGGASWTDVVARGLRVDAAGVPWLGGHGIHWSGSVAFDPLAPRALWVTSGNGVFRTADIDAAPSTWTFTVTGMEETVPLGLVSMAGMPLVSAIGDIDGFVHDDPARHGRIHQPQIGTTTGLDAAAARPGTMVRVGDAMLVTRDGGASWRRTAALAGKRGRVAMSRDGRTLVHTPQGSAFSYRSVDAGASWTRIRGLEGRDLRALADPVQANVFYAHDGRVLLASTDGGASFTPRAGLPPGAARLLRAMPGRTGELWLPLGDGGLARSFDGGASFTTLAGVGYCAAVGFGKAAPGSSRLAVFIWGGIDGIRGVFHSADLGASWRRINDDAHQYGGPGDGQFIVGDMNRHGVVYMSTAGRGIVAGRPAAG